MHKIYTLAQLSQLYKKYPNSSQRVRLRLRIAGQETKHRMQVHELCKFHFNMIIRLEYALIKESNKEKQFQNYAFGP